MFCASVRCAGDPLYSGPAALGADSPPRCTIRRIREPAERWVGFGPLRCIGGQQSQVARVLAYDKRTRRRLDAAAGQGGTMAEHPNVKRVRDAYAAFDQG